MSKNTNLSFLTDYITADITNGRIGINNASPTVAFDVVGATKITGALTLTSTISNGTYTYTLPSATGTLALTSALSSYLPLTGGTLTGALAGTSATFSSTVQTGGYIGINAAPSIFYCLFAKGSATTSASYGAFISAGTNSSDTSFVVEPYSGASTYFKIRGDGNVGIGTTTPNQLLCLRKTSVGAETIALALQNVGNTAGTAVSMTFAPHDSGDPSTPEPLAKISAIRMVNVNAITDLALYTYGIGGLTEKMRVLSAGDLVVGGTTSPLAEPGRGGITINGSLNSLLTYTSGGVLSGYIYHSGSGGVMAINNSKNNATITITSYTNGVSLATNATSWTAISDIRLKNIISPIDSAVDKLTTLNPVIFSWKSDDTNKENIGLIAQDVKEVFPQVIDTNEEGFLGVRYSELVPVLVKAIQELKTEIETLKNK